VTVRGRHDAETRGHYLYNTGAPPRTTGSTRWSDLISPSPSLSGARCHFAVWCVQRLDGQVSVTEALRYSHLYMQRTTAEENRAKRQSYLRALLDKLQREFVRAQELIAEVSKNLDFAQGKLVMSMHSGKFGRANIGISEVLLQAPVHLDLSLSAAMNMGYVSPVPYVISVRPLASGNVHIEVGVDPF